jgi:hypothetical protein
VPEKLFSLPASVFGLLSFCRNAHPIFSSDHLNQFFRYVWRNCEWLPRHRELKLPEDTISPTSPSLANKPINSRTSLRLTFCSRCFACTLSRGGTLTSGVAIRQNIYPIIFSAGSHKRRVIAMLRSKAATRSWNSDGPRVSVYASNSERAMDSASPPRSQCCGLRRIHPELILLPLQF